MIPPLQIQILKKGNRYTVRSRSKAWLSFWWYGEQECLWPRDRDWGSKERAERIAANLRQWDADRRAFKAARVEILSERA